MAMRERSRECGRKELKRRSEVGGEKEDEAEGMVGRQKTKREGCV